MGLVLPIFKASILLFIYLADPAITGLSPFKYLPLHVYFIKKNDLIT